MTILYILESEIGKKIYIGITSNIERRISEHNQGKSPYTRKYKPWKLIYKCEYPTRSEANLEEKRLKKLKSKKYIKWLIEQSRLSRDRS